ncbi:MAG: tyrosine-type recombinase/integrase [Solirubrobacteraceae bacterium]|nr:tyrosine-type recombinase/integrase [Solirubrobacteraceae bacterium]
MSRRSGQARTGEIKRTATGWAIRYRDARGNRKQRAGFRTKADAKKALDEELRKASLGPLHRPEVTLRELVDVFMEQYEAAPASREWMRHHLGKATAELGDIPLGELDALTVSRWRAKLPLTTRHGAHRALRQVLAAAVRWQWIERSVALDVANPMHARDEFQTFESWQEVDTLAAELGDFGPLVIFCVGTGVRPEEAFGADWTDIDLDSRIFTVRRAYAKRRLKPYPKTQGSRRRVPLRAKVVEALQELPARDGVLFPRTDGGRIDINNFRSREWAPALVAAGIEHRRIYDMRHTFATWSLAAGMSIFTLSRRMGTSVQMIDRTYGHLAQDAEQHDRALLDAYDAEAGAESVGT